MISPSTQPPTGVRDAVGVAGARVERPGPRIALTISTARADPGWQPPRFAELYCEREGIGVDAFFPELYRQTLPWPARWLARLPVLLRPSHYAADFDFLSDVAETRTFTDYELAVERYRAHPLNRGWLRRFGKLRISIGRMNRIAGPLIFAAALAERRGRG